MIQGVRDGSSGLRAAFFDGGLGSGALATMADGSKAVLVEPRVVRLVPRARPRGRRPPPGAGAAPRAAPIAGGAGSAGSVAGAGAPGPEGGAIGASIDGGAGTPPITGWPGRARAGSAAGWAANAAMRSGVLPGGRKGRWTAARQRRQPEVPRAGRPSPAARTSRASSQARAGRPSPAARTTPWCRPSPAARTTPTCPGRARPSPAARTTPSSFPVARPSPAARTSPGGGPSRHGGRARSAPLGASPDVPARGTAEGAVGGT